MLGQEGPELLVSGKIVRTYSEGPANISDRNVNYCFKKEIFSFNLTFQLT